MFVYSHKGNLCKYKKLRILYIHQYIYTQLHTHACTVSKLPHLKKMRCGLIISNKIKCVKDQNLPGTITLPRHPGPPKLRFGMTGPPKIHRSNAVHLRRYDCMSRAYRVISTRLLVTPKSGRTYGMIFPFKMPQAFRIFLKVVPVTSKNMGWWSPLINR